MKFFRAGLSASAILAASPAFAHLDPHAHGSFAAGFTHPISGLDHVLAMVAVGLWGALIGGRGIWLLPTGFVGSMIIGYALALLGLHLPGVEPMIMASVIALGAVVLVALRLPAVAGALVCGLFGLFHGHAHGGELGGAGEMKFAIGFVLATAILHGCGVLFGYGAMVGLGAETKRGEMAIRFLGGVTALGGAYLAVMS